MSDGSFCHYCRKAKCQCASGPKGGVPMARVKVTPKLLKRLLDGKPLTFKFPSPIEKIEIVLEEDIFAKFDRVFAKVWNKALDRLDKLA